MDGVGGEVIPSYVFQDYIQYLSFIDALFWNDLKSLSTLTALSQDLMVGRSTPHARRRSTEAIAPLRKRG